MKQLFAALVITLIVSGCTTGRVISGQDIPPTVSTEGKLAIQGRAVVAACEGILNATDAAVTAKVLTTAQALPVGQACRQVGLMGQKLATALRVLDAVKTVTAETTAATTDAKGFLTAMSDAITALPQSTRSIIIDAVGAFFSAISSLRGMLPQ